MNAPFPAAEQRLVALGPAVRAEPYGPGLGLPVFLHPEAPELAASTDAAVAWIAARRELLDHVLADIGAVVFRGFALPDTAAFCRAIDHYPDMEFGYRGGATPRAAVQGRAFEATRAPASAKLTFHQEMSYLPRYPKKLAFFCNHAPETGGETLIADVRRFDDLLPRSFRDSVAQRGVRYTRNFRSPDWSTGNADLDTFHRPWTEAFETTDPKQAEADCLAQGLEYEWVENGSLSVIYTAPGVTTHPLTGRSIWFNQIPSQARSARTMGAERKALSDRHYGHGSPWPYSTTFGDGGPIPEEELAAVYPILDEIEVAFPWRNGDLMLLDNLYVFHGRNPYTGHRDVQVALLG